MSWAHRIPPGYAEMPWGGIVTAEAEMIEGASDHGRAMSASDSGLDAALCRGEHACSRREVAGSRRPRASWDRDRSLSKRCRLTPSQSSGHRTGDAAAFPEFRFAGERRPGHGARAC